MPTICAKLDRRHLKRYQPARHYRLSREHNLHIQQDMATRNITFLSISPTTKLRHPEHGQAEQLRSRHADRNLDSGVEHRHQQSRQ